MNLEYSNMIFKFVLFFSPHDTELYVDVPRTRLPIVYHPIYNITFMGMEKLHPFDAGKWGKVVRFLKGSGVTLLPWNVEGCVQYK